MRWADLDMLGHVNNVVFVDYLQEARADMLRSLGATFERDPSAGPPAGEAILVVRQDVTYLAPLLLRPEPVLIECWVTEIRAASFTMAYELYHLIEGERTTYARATTLLTPFLFGADRPRRLDSSEREALSRFLEPTEMPAASLTDARGGDVGPPQSRAIQKHYPLTVRFSDLDVYGHVNNVKYFEYFQEARLPLVSRLLADVDGHDLNVVVARAEVHYRQSIQFRPRPYDVWSWIVRVGTRSTTLESEIRDGDQVLSRARVTLVFFDGATQRSADPPAELRERLLKLMTPGE